MEAAPTLYGRRYLSEPSAEEPRHLMWSLRGEHAALAEATAPEDVTDAGRPIARCVRLRGAGDGRPRHSTGRALSALHCGRFAAMARPFIVRTLTRGENSSVATIWAERRKTMRAGGVE